MVIVDKIVHISMDAQPTNHFNAHQVSVPELSENVLENQHVNHYLNHSNVLMVLASMISTYVLDH